MITFLSLLKQGIETLEKAGVPDASTDGRMLMEYCFGMSREKLLLSYETEIPNEDKDIIDRYSLLIRERAGRIPLQHIIGTTDFMGLEFEVNENVLVPRFDTEILVEEALKEINDSDNILDMCTGTGCILISLLNYSNNCRGTGVDVSEKALETAGRNADRILTARNDISINFVKSDMFAGLESSEKFDVIVSNPPYIETDEIEKLSPEVKDFDPRIALDGGNDGLMFYRIIAKECSDYLKPGGKMFLEIGWNQAEAVRELLEKAGLVKIEVVKDYAGLDRVVRAERKINYV